MRKKTFTKRFNLRKRTVAHLNRVDMMKVFAGLGGGDGTETDTCTESCPNSCIRTLCNDIRTEADCPLTS